MGRTGTLWAYEQTRRRAGRDDDAPRRSAAGCRSARWSPRRELRDVLAPGDHGSTFAGGPLVAAAALAALEVIDDPGAAGAVCASSASGCEARSSELAGVARGARARA